MNVIARSPWSCWGRTAALILDRPKTAMAEAAKMSSSSHGLRLRSYQAEMLEASLRGNVIVAMDTGSGKTQVAVHRIRYQLEHPRRSQSGSQSSTQPANEQLVWFMAPSVALCEQQYRVLAEHLPAYLTKKLLGSDGVDKWTQKRLWDLALANVQIVVSTPAVLADALTHGFVPMPRLALLIFDECHRCIKNSPMNLIMKDFYHPAKNSNQSVPDILGLSASPIISARSSTLQDLETNLDSTVVTPKQHRGELERYVHPPSFTTVVYKTVSRSELPATELHRTLFMMHRNYDTPSDPYVLSLLSHEAHKYAKVLTKDKTWCRDQINMLVNTGFVVLEQLGPCVVDGLLQDCIEAFKRQGSCNTIVLPDTVEKEHRHLLSLIEHNVPAQLLTSQNDLLTDPISITPKAHSLIDILDSQQYATKRIIIFVEQRAVVVALAHLLRTRLTQHKATAIGTFVGTSQHASRKNIISSMYDIRAQENELKAFRAGDISIMISTSVLEEGIDVSGCNSVICFDPPKNLVSFVQRRGRARKKEAEYIIFVSADDMKADPSRWAQLEEQMKKAYREENREIAPAEDIEDESELARFHRIDATGALLTFDNAKAHLHHFCNVSTLHNARHVDPRPIFETYDGADKKSWTAKVSLPAFVHSKVRTAKSLRTWKSEVFAIKDAAFQAYVALHQAGLVNDNLLPLAKESDLSENFQMIKVSERHSSWTRVCEIAAEQDGIWFASPVDIELDADRHLSLQLCLPVPLGQIEPFSLYWNDATQYIAQIGAGKARSLAPELQQSSAGRAMTETILRSAHRNRMLPDRRDFPFLIYDDYLNKHSNLIDGTDDAWNLARGAKESLGCGLIRPGNDSRSAYFFSRLVPESDGSEPTIWMTKFPKRKDFLHQVQETNLRDRQHAFSTQLSIAVAECKVDRLPARYALFAALLPSLLHRIDLRLSVDELRQNVLGHVRFSNSALLQEALTAPSAYEPTNYNRLELLGDTVLKFAAVLHLLAEHIYWPERYLSQDKDRIVDNNNLCKAALELGLDRYIVTKAFTGAKWLPPYIGVQPSQPSPLKRSLSSKCLADVVESLIGAAYLDGGLDNAVSCIRLLLPRENVQSPAHCTQTILESIQPIPPVQLAQLERLVGHEFARPTLLVEAITHASYSLTTNTASYERLEFLGDAVLDLIVVDKLFAHPRQLNAGNLSLVKSALVNGDLLGYACMCYGIEIDRFDMIPLKRVVHLHDFVRADSQMLLLKQRSLARYAQGGATISQRLENAGEYPWIELFALRPDKYMSDLVESILGAIYLDTNGDLGACESFVSRLGISKVMDRILHEHIEVTTPKAQLGIRAVSDTVHYNVITRKDEQGGVFYDCTVKVAEKEMGTASACGSRAEAEHRAAYEALQSLQKESQIGIPARPQNAKSTQESDDGGKKVLKRQRAELVEDPE